MTSFCKTKNFLYGGPAFTESNNTKYNWAAFETSEIDLDSYNDEHEVLRVDIKYDQKLTEGHETWFRIRFYDDITGEEIFTWETRMEQPSELGYQYFQYVEGRAWIGKIDYELWFETRIRVEASVTSNQGPSKNWTRYVIIHSTKKRPTEVICTPGTQKCIGADLYVCNTSGTEWVLKEQNASVCSTGSDCPDFFTDPVGAVLCWIIGAWEAMLGLTTGGFTTLLYNINNFMNDYSVQVVRFITDPVKYIEDLLKDSIATVSDVSDGIVTGISDWWTAASTDVVTWIANAIAPISSWIDTSYSNIGKWWDDTKTGISNWFTDQWKNLNDFWMDITKAISDWWTSTVADTFISLQNTVSAISSWVDTSYSSIEDWWTSTQAAFTTWVWETVSNATDYLTDNVIGFFDWLNTLQVSMTAYIGLQIKDSIDYMTSIVPEMVESMFDWAKPIVKPISDAVGFLGELTSIFTGQHPEDPRMTKAKEDYKQIIERAHNLVRK